MILEIAMLQVKLGQTAAFEAAFAHARSSLEDHTVGFRQSAHYLRWKALLHHFYDPFPTVLHYVPV